MASDVPKEPREKRAINITFDTIAEKEEWLAYAKDRRHMPLATLVKVLLEEDRESRKK